MFSLDRVLDKYTPRALYPYCPFRRSRSTPLCINMPGADVGCLVDNLLNSHKRMHIHPEDLSVFRLALDYSNSFQCRHCE